ncbi:MAG: hypothetical protein M3A44_13130 [Gammaproteobacteria bacterium]
MSRSKRLCGVANAAPALSSAKLFGDVIDRCSAIGFAVGESEINLAARDHAIPAAS